MSNTRHEIKSSIKLFLPLFCSQLVYAISTFIGTAMIARLGEKHLAGLAIGSITYTTLCVFFFGIFVGIGILVAENEGAKNHSRTNNIISQGVILAVICTFFFVGVMLVAPKIFVFLGQDQETIEISSIYLSSLSLSILPWLLCVVFEQFLIGLSKTKLVMIISIIQVPLEIFINYTLVFGKFGFPEFGVAGLGYGFTATFVLSLIAFGILSEKHKDIKKHNILGDFFSCRFELLKKLAKTGLPVGAINIIENLFFLVMTFLIGIVGIKNLAAQQIIRQYVELVVTLGLSLTQATTIRASLAYGENNFSTLSTAIRANMSIIVFLMFFILVVYSLFSNILISMDIDVLNKENKEIIDILSRVFILVGVFQLIDGVRLVAIGALRSLHDNVVPMWITVAIFWLVSLPLGYYFCFIENLQLFGMWLGVLIGMLVGTIIVLLRLKVILNRQMISAKRHV